MALMQIIIFAAIAAFVLIKLYNVLGKDVGAPPQQPSQNNARIGVPVKPSSASVTPLPVRPAFTGPAAAGLEAIRSADSGFDPQHFLEGAKVAYERIVVSFANGEKKALKDLLQADVFARYSDAIDARETAIDTEIIRIKKAEIKEAALENREATVVVEFSAELSTRETPLNAVEDDDGAEANVQQSSTTEEWTFVRDARSRNPNWKLASVSTLA